MRASLLTVLWLVSGLAVGCGESGPPRKEVYPVTGKITMHGTPLTGAMVSFAPKSGQPTAVGQTNELGEFSLTTYEPNDGAAAGDYAVVVTKVVSAPPASGAEAGHSSDPYATFPDSHNASGTTGGAVTMVPPKYSNANETPLTATVKPEGPNHFEFQVD